MVSIAYYMLQLPVITVVHILTVNRFLVSLSKASVKLFELGVCFGAYGIRRWYRFSAFSYAKPSDFRHNFRPYYSKPRRKTYHVNTDFTKV